MIFLLILGATAGINMKLCNYRKTLNRGIKKIIAQKYRIKLLKSNFVYRSKTAEGSSVEDTVSMSSGTVLATLTTHLTTRGVLDVIKMQ